MISLRPERRRLLLVVLCGWLAYSLGAQAQEAQRHLDGQVIGGYSGYNVTGQSVDGPYAGVNADLSGYWNDPRILIYDVNTMLERGFQWAGPMSGPDANGVNAASTFLAGSRMPLRVYFTHLNIPTPDLGLQGGANFQGFSRVQQNYGFDWMGNFAHLPTIDVHYSHDSYTAQYPVNLGGDIDSLNQEFRVGLQHVIAKWHLGASYSRDTAEADTMALLSATGSKIAGTTDGEAFAATASRVLPLHSEVQLNAGSNRSTYDVTNTTTKISYKRASGALTTRWTDRLTTNVQTAYISSYSDYARQQLLQPGSNNPPLLNPALVGVETGLLSYGAGASFRVINGLTAHATYGASTIVDSVASLGLGDSRTVSGGMTYFHSVYGGQLGASYDVINTRFEVPQTLSISANNESTAHTGTLSYSHPLPWKIRFSGAADITQEDVQYTFYDSVFAYGFNLDVARRVNDRWDLHGRLNWRAQNHDYPYHNENSSKLMALTLVSKRLQVDVSQGFDDGLAYQFGTGVILTPGASPFPVPGLPLLILTSGDSFNVAATYRVKRNFTVRGLWMHGNRSINNVSLLAQTAYDFRGDYGFRKLHFAAGYARNWQDFLRVPGSTGYYTRTLYFEVRRDFHFF